MTTSAPAKRFHIDVIAATAATPPAGRYSNFEAADSSHEAAETYTIHCTIFATKVLSLLDVLSIEFAVRCVVRFDTWPHASPRPIAGEAQRMGGQAQAARDVDSAAGSWSASGSPGATDELVLDS